jgi:hypothetical protein
MAGAIDMLKPDSPKQILILASNPAVSEQTGCPIGFWRSELTHPPIAVICHATCTLLEARHSEGRMLVEAKTWTGFAGSEEDYAD